MRKPVIIAILIVLALTCQASGQIPQIISYQGRLTTSSCVNVADGNYSLTFVLYDASTGGTSLWTETQPVDVSGGLFAVNLGAVTAIALAFDKPYWLGVTVAGGAELMPRTALTTTGYSYRSAVANYSNQAGSISAPLMLQNSSWSMSTLEAHNFGGGIGLFAESWKFATGSMGVNGGLKEPAIPPTGHWAIFGWAQGNGDSVGIGVVGKNAYSGTEGDLGTWSDGVLGRSYAGAGVHGIGDGGDGLVGEATTANKSGVFAINTNPSGYAGFFTGQVYVNGTLNKVAGGFKIDHPLEPANKYLQHSFVESPDMMNVYNGNVITDSKGDATIVLPNWFEALNQDFRYQLTCIGKFAQAIVAEEIANNQFTIKTDKPNVKVSWQVTGIRHDAYAEAHRLQVEIDKQGPEQGKYVSPLEHGQPASSGMYYDEISVRYQEEGTRR